MPSMVGIVSCAPAVDVWCFLSFFIFLSRFGMTKFVIMETLWSGIIFKTIMVSLHRGRFLVVHLCLSFPIDPQNFPGGGQFLPKNYHFWRFLGPYSHIFKTTAAKFGMRVRSWGFLPLAKFCKKSLQGIYPFGKNLYQKLPFLGMF